HVTIEKNEELALKEREIMNQYINKIIESLSYKNSSEVEETVQLLHTDEFYEIATKKEFYKDLSKELKRKYTGNVVILQTLKNIYGILNFLDNEDMNINIMAVLEERVSLFEKYNKTNKKNVIKKMVKIIAFIGILCFILVGYFGDKNKLQNKIPNESEICSLIKEQYGVDISPESIYDEDDIDLFIGDTLPNEKIYSQRVYYTTNDGNQIFFNSLFSEYMDNSSEIKFNLEKKLFNVYIKNYLYEYINKDHTVGIDLSDLYCVMDYEQLIMEFDVTEEQIDSFIDSLYDFKEAYWSEIPVSSRNTEYQFTVHFYYEGEKGYFFKHERNDVVIILTTSNSDIDKEALRKQIRGD
ncbi:hypothetical protein, partial [Anaerosporobacter sp.]